MEVKELRKAFGELCRLSMKARNRPVERVKIELRKAAVLATLRELNHV